MDRPTETILIVDDDELNRELLSEYVQMLGFAPICVSGGQEALERMGPDICAVLLDVMMPEMDGYEVTRRIKAHGSWSDIPVILVTALTDRVDKLRGVEAGASDFISKPIDPTELKVRLSAQLKMKRAKEALDEAREQEVAIAAEIQSTLLFGKPPADIPGVQISAFTASSAKIDGDFYHFFVYDDRHFDIAVGDVMGKGIPAAVLGAAAKSAIQQAISHAIITAPGSYPCPSDLADRVHHSMTPHLMRLDTFITLAYAHIDLENNRLVLVDCGHTSAVNYRAGDSQCQLLRGDNLPLGVAERETHEAVEIGFSKGDIVVFYSDGVTEAENASGEMFSAARLADVVAKHCSACPDRIIRAIRTAVEDFAGGSTFSDDLTLVVLKIGGPETNLIEHAVLDVLSSLDNLDRIGNFVRDFCARSANLLPADIDALELVVNEAIVNIIEHSYNSQDDLPISIHLHLTASAIIIHIYDWAEPFEITDARMPSFDGSRSDGFGLFIIESNTTKAVYSRDAEGRNCCLFIREIPFKKENA